MQALTIRVEDQDAAKATVYAFIRSPVRIGRSERNDLSLPDPSVSGWHATIEFGSGDIRYTDLGSTNGSVISGAVVRPHEPVVVAPGTVVQIGSCRLKLSGGTQGLPSSTDLETKEQVTVSRTQQPGPKPIRPGSITELMLRMAGAGTPESPLAWQHVLFPGSMVGRFELVREIGRGGFGVVFEAKDTRLGRLVAFKALRPGRESRILAGQEQMQREAEAVARLSHPNVVSLFDAGSFEGLPFLIFELLRGQDLRARMAHGTLTWREALDVSIDVAWALDHAHSQGIIHRDVKPSNVFVCERGATKVLDFGIAHVFGARDLRAAGTPPYMAPEQWRGQAEDPRTDVFGAAVVLYEALTGRLPYATSDDRSAVLEPGAEPEMEVPGIPPTLSGHIRQALQADPAKRPADGRRWLNGLLEARERLDSGKS